MSSQKRNNSIKRMKKKQRQSIHKLFDRLRDDTFNSQDKYLNESVVIISDSLTENNLKRKASEEIGDDNTKKRNNNLLVLQDDDVILTEANFSAPTTPSKTKMSAPVCSTPILRGGKSATNLNLSFVSVYDNKLSLNNNLDLVKNLNDDINDLTKEINRDSYVTIDLTTDSVQSRENKTGIVNSVVDLVNRSDCSDCTFVSATSRSSSMTGDSEVTVINTARRKGENKKMKKFVAGIANMNASEKGRLLELITKNIFNGCQAPSKKESLCEVKTSENRGTETVEDTYIKEVILGQTPSRNSIGSNIYNPEKDPKNKQGLKLIVIDGSNVAMEHTKGRVFSVKGLKICIEYFLRRGHVVKAFVPRFRCKYGMSSEPRVLDELERRGHVVYTPSRYVQGRNICSYDDRYIVQCAAEFDGIIVSGDNYRDLLLENPRWRFVIENRLLQFTWVDDMIMFPRDPLGRNGPTLEQFLRHN